MHFGTQEYSVAGSDGLAHVDDEVEDVVRGGASTVDDEIRMLGADLGRADLVSLEPQVVEQFPRRGNGAPGLRNVLPKFGRSSGNFSERSAMTASK
jgi:hypothetical protein